MCKIGDRWVVNPSGGLLSKGGQNIFFVPMLAPNTFYNNYYSVMPDDDESIRP